MNAMNNEKCIIFDLYGTLLRVDQNRFIKELAKTLRINTRALARKVFLDCMTTQFHRHEDMIQNLLDSTGQLTDELTIKEGVALIDQYVAKVTPVDGAHNVLSFLKSCGYRLGLISNAITPFKLPLYNTNLHSYFDEVIFSCDVRLAKPDSRIYQLMCDALKATPSDCIFIGDSRQNDYVAPIEFGMKSILIDGSGKGNSESVRRLYDLGWYSFNDGKFIAETGGEVKFDRHTYFIDRLEALSDDESGKYNIVSRATLRDTNDGETRTVYFKRFSQPGSAAVEELAYEIYALVGASHCTSEIINTGESILITSEIAGEPWDDRHINQIAYQLGFHLAMAYIFSYADLRPRNIILQRKSNGDILLNVIDLEHCFFSLALDLTDLNDIFSPSTFNVLCRDELATRTRRNVLSIKNCKRVIKGFIPEFDATRRSNLTDGWIDAFARVKFKLTEIENRLRDSIINEPYPIIGTHAYRRAMANIDIDEIVRRSNENGKEILEMLI